LGSALSLALANGSCLRSYRSMLKDCHITSGHRKDALGDEPCT
jgi:hypothetical protein